MSSKKDIPVYILIAAASIAIFVLDLSTRLGIADWVFYGLITAATVFQSRKYAPFVVMAGQILLVIAGFVLASEGIDPQVAALNRTLGVITILGIAVLAHFVIAERGRVRRLLWLQQGQGEVSRSLIGEQEPEEIGNNLVKVLSKYLGAQVGVLYRLEGHRLLRTGAYAVEQAASEIQLGQGLAGQVAVDAKPVLVTNLPQDYLRIGSALGEGRPQAVIVAPITAGGVTNGVVELGFAQAGKNMEDALELLGLVGEAAGVAVRSALYRQHLKELLEETQRQSEELQTQQEELRVSNEELEEQSRVLQESQTRLENQQAELEQTNVRLEEQTQMLQQQKNELLHAQGALRASAEELARANRYKSEFLANMSHELRTPLNSALILSQILSENRSGGMSEEEVRYAQTIYSSNNDLLNLINDILDLSKIEAGHVNIQAESASIAGIVEPLRHVFEPVAKEKGIVFQINMQDGLPPAIVTDVQRLQQILRNLLSNAFKFTEKGEVVLHVAPSAPDRIRFSVRDTGIGIPEHQQEIIFEAFRQADGTTSRKYGGTGLGLSISRELASRLQGHIEVSSEPGVGSTFSLEIATHLIPAAEPLAVSMAPAPKPAADDAARGALPSAQTPPAPKAARTEPAAAAAPRQDTPYQRKHDRLILVVEDDARFAAVMSDLITELQFDCVCTASGAEAYRLARELRPNGVLLDVGLPDHSGLSVLERLKRDPATRHIPVHMISVDDYMQTALELGAIGYVIKPAAKEELVRAIAKLEDKLQQQARRILVVEDDEELRRNIALLLEGADVEITTVGTVANALEHLSNATFDCMVMDLVLPDGSGYDLLEKMAAGDKYAFPPVIVYTGRMLTREEEHRLRRYSKSIIIKGARSPERLLDEVTLFLHQVESNMPAPQRELLKQARQRDAVFEGRRILLAEDDVRNIFALSSVFEPLGATLDIARNGKEALQRLEEDDDIDLVLMDIMMPEMDGLTAIREIRRRRELERLPVIALTAKAMPNDRQECLDAGANDYVAKPINVEKLVSLCRVWMPK